MTGEIERRKGERRRGEEETLQRGKKRRERVETQVDKRSERGKGRKVKISIEEAFLCSSSVTSFRQAERQASLLDV